MALAPVDRISSLRRALCVRQAGPSVDALCPTRLDVSFHTYARRALKTVVPASGRTSRAGCRRLDLGTPTSPPSKRSNCSHSSLSLPSLNTSPASISSRALPKSRSSHSSFLNLAAVDATPLPVTLISSPCSLEPSSPLPTLPDSLRRAPM